MMGDITPDDLERIHRRFDEQEEKYKVLHRDIRVIVNCLLAAGVPIADFESALERVQDRDLLQEVTDPKNWSAIEAEKFWDERGGETR